MTDPLLFDTDCLSAFLWVDGQSLLAQMYPQRIAIPEEVHAELSRPGVPHLKRRVESMLTSGVARIERIQTDGPTYRLYRKLTHHPDAGHRVIGRGEAAAISLAKEMGGILASNNLRDVSSYVREFNLRHVTTGDIMMEALGLGLITEASGNALWQSMIAKRRRLGYDTFTDFLQSNGRCATRTANNPSRGWRCLQPCAERRSGRLTHSRPSSL